MTYKTKTLLAALAIALQAAGCGDDDGAADARLRVIHLSPDAPAVDVFVDGAAAFTDLVFEEGTDYASLAAGAYDIAVAPAGAGVGSSVLDVPGLVLEEGVSYTAVAFDELANIQPLALVDDAEGLAAGNIRVRPVHTATAVGQVDIWDITNPGAPALLWENVDFGVAGDAADIPAGAYTIGLDVDDDAVPDVAFDLPSLAAGTVVNVFAVNDASDDVFLLAQLDSSSVVRIDPRGPTAHVRVVHLSPDAPAVDVFVDDAASPAVSDLAFREGTGWIALPAGTYDFDVAPTGTTAGDSVLAVDSVALGAGDLLTVVAIGRVADLPAGDKPLEALAIAEDFSALGAGNIGVNVAHAAPAFDQVDVWDVTGTPAPLVPNFDYGATTGRVELPAAAYVIGIDANDDATPDVTFDVPALPAGTIANVFASSDDDGNPALVAQLAGGTIVVLSPNP